MLFLGIEAQVLGLLEMRLLLRTDNEASLWSGEAAAMQLGPETTLAFGSLFSLVSCKEGFLSDSST